MSRASPCCRTASTPRNAVYVALHEVAAQPVADPQGALEVHPSPASPVADRGPTERRDDGANREPTLAVLDHGEARAVDGNALTVDEIAVAALDAKLASGLGVGDARNRSNVVDQSGKHEISWSA